MPQITSVVVINVDPERLKKEESSIDSSEVSKEDFTEGGLWGWLAVLGAFLTFFAPLGLMNSFGSFQVILNLQIPKAMLIDLCAGVLLVRLSLQLLGDYNRFHWHTELRDLVHRRYCDRPNL